MTAKSENKQQLLAVRYNADVVASFKASGKGWQTRMNDAQRDWLRICLKGFNKAYMDASYIANSES